MTPRHIIPTALAAIVLAAMGCGSRSSEQAEAQGETGSTLTAKIRQTLKNSQLSRGRAKHLIDFPEHSDAGAER